MVTIRPSYKYDCDVLIAGGGPAGSALAFHLAKKGWKVIVAEGERFPRDKVCGDGVSPVALQELHAMGITSTEKFMAANEISKVGLFIGEDKVVINLSKPENLRFNARIIPRIELDHWIYQAAKSAGAVYAEDTRVNSYQVTESGVIVNLKNNENYSIKTKVIVGADGSSSCISRQLNGARPVHEYQLLGLRAYYENVNGPSDRVDIFFSKESFPGIFWMFPKRENGANIGMAMVASTLPKNTTHVKNMLLNHINSNGEILKRIGNGKINGKITGWPLTFFNADSCISSERVILVGDAAGLINPLSGDGIQYALLSGRWAADVLHDGLKKNDLSAASLNRYRGKVDEELGYDFALSNLLVQFGRNKALNPVWMEILKTMIARARDDEEYADTIAGIFAGNYPSHKALNTSFILKTILQSGSDVSKSAMAALLPNPSGAVAAGLQLSQQAVNILESLIQQPGEQGKWLKNTAKKMMTVAGHIIKQDK
jgi:menaquinone-9 beta-reductase